MVGSARASFQTRVPLDANFLCDSTCAVGAQKFTSLFLKIDITLFVVVTAIVDRGAEIIDLGYSEFELPKQRHTRCWLSSVGQRFARLLSRHRQFLSRLFVCPAKSERPNLLVPLVIPSQVKHGTLPLSQPCK